MHFLCIEVRLSATEHGAGITVLLARLNILERIGAVGNNLNLVERLQIHQFLYIGNY